MSRNFVRLLGLDQKYVEYNYCFASYSHAHVPQDLDRVKARRQLHFTQAPEPGQPIVEDSASEAQRVNEKRADSESDGADENVSPTNTIAPSFDAAFTDTHEDTHSPMEPSSPWNLERPSHLPSRPARHRRNKAVMLTGDESRERKSHLSFALLLFMQRAAFAPPRQNARGTAANALPFTHSTYRRIVR